MLFSKRRNEPAAKAAATAVLELPAPERLVLAAGESDAALGEYLQLATEVGCRTSTISDLVLRRFLQREEMLIYPYNRVAAYLTSLVIATAEREHRPMLAWCWKPLRARDMRVAPRVPRFPAGKGYRYRGNATMHGLTGTWDGLVFPDEQYNQPVPKAALELVKRISDANVTAHFFVSDYAVGNPDPFLAVGCSGAPLYVIHHWDEPGFRLLG